MPSKGVLFPEVEVRSKDEQVSRSIITMSASLTRTQIVAEHRAHLAVKFNQLILVSFYQKYSNLILLYI